MSIKQFKGAAEGAVAENATATAFVQGKPLPTAVQAIANIIGAGVEDLHINNSEIDVIALGRNPTTVTPSGGLEATGDEDVPYKYDEERNTAMFGGTSPS